MGNDEGSNVGWSDGVFVGSPRDPLRAGGGVVGLMEGTSDGLAVGCRDGVSVGSKVGVLVSKAVSVPG